MLTITPFLEYGFSITTISGIYGRRFFFSFCLIASEHLFLEFPYGSMGRVNASLGGTHCDTTTKTTHTTSRSSLCWFLFLPACMFWGYGILRALRLLLCAASLAALVRCLYFFDAFARLEICLYLNAGVLLVKRQKEGSGMVMRARAAMSPRVTIRTGFDIDDRQLSFFA